MAVEDIIAEVECSGWTDGWVELLCMQRNPDGSVTLTSKCEDVLGEENTSSEKSFGRRGSTRRYRRATWTIGMKV